jgi:hypothetical protein
VFCTVENMAFMPMMMHSKRMPFAHIICHNPLDLFTLLVTLYG